MLKLIKLILKANCYLPAVYSFSFYPSASLHKVCSDEIALPLVAHCSPKGLLFHTTTFVSHLPPPPTPTPYASTYTFPSLLIGIPSCHRPPLTPYHLQGPLPFSHLLSELIRVHGLHTGLWQLLYCCLELFYFSACPVLFHLLLVPLLCNPVWSIPFYTHLHHTTHGVSPSLPVQVLEGQWQGQEPEKETFVFLYF